MTGLDKIREKFFTELARGQPDEPNAISLNETNFLLNTAVYDTVTFMGNDAFGGITYTDPDTGKPIPDPIPKLQIPLALCTVTKNINVVKSEIQGRNGSIKQYINTGDYEVVIKGTFTTGTSDFYPANAMRRLQQITNATSEVKVASDFLQLFGINYLVFIKCEFEQGETDGRDIQHFTLSCLSETPFFLKVIKEGTTTNNLNFDITNPDTQNLA